MSETALLLDVSNEALTGESRLVHLNQLRKVRDEILPLAAYALAKHYSCLTRSHNGCLRPFLVKACTTKMEDMDGIEMWGEAISDPLNREAVLKFCQYARMVYEEELKELARVNKVVA